MELIFLPLMFVAMWFLLIRPQQTRLKNQQRMVASLQVGDEVVTAGGVIGTIKILTDREMRLEVGPGVEMRVMRGAVSNRLGPAEVVADTEPDSGLEEER